HRTLSSAQLLTFPFARTAGTTVNRTGCRSRAVRGSIQLAIAPGARFASKFSIVTQSRPRSHSNFPVPFPSSRVTVTGSHRTMLSRSSNVAEAEFSSVPRKVVLPSHTWPEPEIFARVRDAPEKVASKTGGV